jgi:hypothetical protein
MEEVTLPKAPEGYEYRLMKKPSVRYKDPSTLSSKQRAALKYREKNKEKLAEYNRQYMEKKRKKTCSHPGTTPS